MAIPYKLLFKGLGGTFLTQAADALINPEQAGYGSDVVRAVDEVAGDAPFLRKLHVLFNRTPPTGGSEDVDVVTFHLAKLAGEDYTNNWLAADFAAAEARFDTWWTALKPSFPSFTALAGYRWYKIGPGSPLSGPAVRITTRSVAGTGTGIPTPPQCAISITEVTRIRKSWGRFYLPAPVSGTLDGSGRIAASMFPGAGGLLSNSVTLYNGLASDSVPVHVYSAAKPVRTKKNGTTLPAAPARALRVESLQMDDIVDVIRSRRYDHGVTKTRTALA